MANEDVKAVQDDVDSLRSDVDKLRADVEWLMDALSRHGRAYPQSNPNGIFERLDELEASVKSKLK